MQCWHAYGMVNKAEIAESNTRPESSSGDAAHADDVGNNAEDDDEDLDFLSAVFEFEEEGSSE